MRATVFPVTTTLFLFTAFVVFVSASAAGTLWLPGLGVKEGVK